MILVRSTVPSSEGAAPFSSPASSAVDAAFVPYEMCAPVRTFVRHVIGSVRITDRTFVPLFVPSAQGFVPLVKIVAVRRLVRTFVRMSSQVTYRLADFGVESFVPLSVRLSDDVHARHFFGTKTAIYDGGQR